MPLNTAMSLMSALEFILWVALGGVFWAKGLHRRFPAMSAYLVLRVFSMPVLLAFLYLQAQPSLPQKIFFPAYFYSYWAVYVASAVCLYFICIEVYRVTLAPFSGLTRLGTVVFRWAALASVIVSLATVSRDHHGAARVIPDVAFGLMRSVSILELCLLGFLCLSMNVLRTSIRDIAFGIALGFGLMSANDFLQASLIVSNPSLIAPLQFSYEAIILLSLGIWLAYVTLPEPRREPLVMPANSAIYRWNEIASALGHGTKVAVQQPTNGFFLTDVERVVEKVLTRNLQGNESKS
jgi:hypothetical protein